MRDNMYNELTQSLAITEMFFTTLAEIAIIVFVGFVIIVYFKEQKNDDK